MAAGAGWRPMGGAGWFSMRSTARNRRGARPCALTPHHGIPPLAPNPNQPPAPTPTPPPFPPPSRHSRPHPVIPALLFVIPAKAGIHTPKSANPPAAIIPANPPGQPAHFDIPMPPPSFRRRPESRTPAADGLGAMAASVSPPSFPRKRESTPGLSAFPGKPGLWIPACAGMTVGRAGMMVRAKGWRLGGRPGVDSRFRGNDGQGAGMTDKGWG